MKTSEQLPTVLEGLKAGWGSGGSAALEAFLGLWSGCFDANVQERPVDVNSVRFKMEIASIRLRGMGLVPFLLVGGEGGPAEEAVRRFKSEVWYGPKLPIVLCATDAAYVLAKDALPGARGIVLSAAAIGKIAAADDPLSVLRQQMIRQVRFRRLIPFTYTRPVAGHMFFGREEELAMLVDEDHMDYAVSSTGHTGKTSLMRQAEYTLRRDLDPRYARMVSVDLYTCKTTTDAAVQQIAQAIRHTSFSHELGVDGLLAFLRREKNTDARFADGPIELFMDEADGVLAHDKSMGYPLLKVLKHARDQGLARLTLAGRDAPGQVAADHGNPLHERMRRIKLGALSHREARDLLMLPLEHLGLTLEDPKRVVQEVLSDSKRFPMEIQKWGFQIANRAARKAGRVFTLDDLLEVAKTIAQ